MEQLRIPEAYFDPFADESEQTAPEELFQQIMDRYQNNEIEHDYTADKFVADTEALLLDSQFTENFAAYEQITARMHQLCGEDHLLASTMNESSLFSSKHGLDDGHGHASTDDPTHESKGKKKDKQKGRLKKHEHTGPQRKRLSFDDIIKMFLRAKALPKKP